MSGPPQRSSAAASPNQDHRSQPMSQRKSDDTAPPTEPAKPGLSSIHPLWEIFLEEERQLRDGGGTQYAGVPPWAHREIQATRARLKSSPGCLTEKEVDRFNFLLQWQRQEEAYSQERRAAVIEARNLWQQEREQERRRQEQQERERQARRVQELERKMREHKRQALELKKGLETVRALAEAAGDEKTRLAIVRTALAEIARSGREKRAEKLETDPWRICARTVILAAIEGNPALNNTTLTDKVVEGLKTDKIRGRSRRQIERVITDMRDGGIIPPLPPR